MDLKNAIRPDLWNEISNSYIAENYVNSIQIAMVFLSKTIQEKSGLDLDGVQLVNQAFGGEEPKLRLNIFQTKTEKDEQRGFHSIISGLYSAIRNPRAHEIIRDSKNDADPIIYFIDYILNKIDVARPPYKVEEFIPRVYDKDFIANETYTSELVKEIPRKKYLETLIEIYRNKPKGRNVGVYYVFKELAKNITQSELEELMAVISRDLDTLSDDDSISMVLQMIPKKSWHLVKPSSKMRIENKLINAIKIGKQNSNFLREYYGPNGKPRDEGKLGRSAVYVLDEFTLKNELIDAITSQLTSGNSERHRYVIMYFLPRLPELLKDTVSYKHCAQAMKRLIMAGDKMIKHIVIEFLKTCPEDWLLVIKETFNDITDYKMPGFKLRDGSPFLSIDYIDLPPEYEDYDQYDIDPDDIRDPEYGTNEDYF
jgi:uncharacterized protein (TIGR02391 family)